MPCVACMRLHALWPKKKKKERERERESEMGITLIVGDHIRAVTQRTRGSDTTD